MTTRDRAVCRRAYKQWHKDEYLKFCTHFSLNPKDGDYHEESHEPSREWKAAFRAGVNHERREAHYRKE